jgi:hypothetical protein
MSYLARGPIGTMGIDSTAIAIRRRRSGVGTTNRHPEAAA